MPTEPLTTLDAPILDFQIPGLDPILFAATQKAGYTTPTPIQAKAIPVALEDRDLIGLAETGTGKTMAFALPMLNRLLAHRSERGLIIVPTRELALQVEQSIKVITRFMNPAPRTVSLIGGMPIYRQIRELKSNPSIIIATPGRLRDHLEQRTIELSKVSMLVLDEADRMLDMGFAPQIRLICDLIPENRQTMLFSATFAPEIAKLAGTYLRNPTRIEIARVGVTSAQIEQQLCYVHQAEKRNLLEKLLLEHPGTVLVFTRTKHGATKLTTQVKEMGYTAAEMHSNRSLGQRRQALDGFKSGIYRVLVATDVAARGIDVKDISLVINYDLPDAAEDYVHRIGRTGRAGKTGLAISFATPEQQRDVHVIERHVGRTIPLAQSSLSAPAPQQYNSPFNGPRRAQQSRPRNFAPRSRPSYGRRFDGPKTS